MSKFERALRVLAHAAKKGLDFAVGFVQEVNQTTGPPGLGGSPPPSKATDVRGLLPGSGFRPDDPDPRDDLD
ncbi:MAG: hypothetical protein J2P28_21990 [Actinobacteria bacterium]|nr:hypothetical protein [Actinomycetota bacterium]